MFDSRISGFKGGCPEKNLDFWKKKTRPEKSRIFFSGGGSRKKNLDFWKKIQKSRILDFSGGGVQKKNSGFSGQKSRNPEFWISGFSFLQPFCSKTEILEIQNSGFLDFFFPEIQKFFSGPPPPLRNPEFWISGFLSRKSRIFFLDTPP